MTDQSKPVMYMLVGLPAIGKTTWVNQDNVGVPPWQVVSSDNHLMKLAEKHRITYDQAFFKYAKDATAEMYKDLDGIIKRQVNFIWDQTNLTVKARKGKLARVPAEYKKIAVVFKDAPADKTREYLNRLDSRPGKNIPSHVIAQMRQTYEMPTEAEGFDEIIYIQAF